MKRILIFFMFFCVSCGYQPIYLDNNSLNTEFNEIIIIGEEKIKRQIIKGINLRENISSNKKLIIETSYKIIETSKDVKGQIETYKSLIVAKMRIEEGKKILKEKNFSKEFLYGNNNNKYELKRYQNDIKKNLVNELINEIILFLRLL